MSDTARTLTGLMPELIVAATGAAVIVADLVAPRTARQSASPRPWIAALAIAGLVAAALAALGAAGEANTLFDGLVIVDGLTTFFRLVFIGIAIAVIALSVDVLPRFTRWAAEFHAFVLWCTLGHMLLAATGELFTIFLALQLTSLPLIVLIGFAKRDPRSGEASLKYLLLVLVSTAVLLYGMTLIYGALGTSTISEIGAALEGMETVTPVLAAGLVLLLTGFAFKITAVPFHWWVPDVYTGAPTPVTAFLSVGSKFAGFALALRIVVTGLHLPLDWHVIFGVMAALSMTLGNLAAIPQTDIKRMLAYSGIAQAGYLLVGIAASSPGGVSALLVYIVAYGLANLAAFSVVIAVERAGGSTAIEGYAGLAKRAPLMALSLAIALLSLAGLPLLGGFVAKFDVFLQAARSGLVWLVAIGVVNSVVSLYYYLRVLWYVYVAEGESGPLTVPGRGAAVMGACALGVVVLGVYPEPLLRAAATASRALFGG